MKQKILDILQDYFADEKMIEEITAVLDKDASMLSEAVSLLNNKALTQQEIHDWATLNGYVMVKCASVADRLKVEKVAREIWGSKFTDNFLE